MLLSLLLLLFLLSRQFDSFRQFSRVCICNKLLCSSIGVMSGFFAIIPVQKFLIVLQVFFLHFYFISLFVDFFSLLICFCFALLLLFLFIRDEIPNSKQKETNLHFCHSNRFAVHKQNSWSEYNRKKNTQTHLLGLFVKIELMEHRVI